MQILLLIYVLEILSENQITICIYVHMYLYHTIALSMLREFSAFLCAFTFVFVCVFFDLIYSSFAEYSMLLLCFSVAPPSGSFSAC